MSGVLGLSLRFILQVMAVLHIALHACTSYLHRVNRRGTTVVRESDRKRERSRQFLLLLPPPLQPTTMAKQWTLWGFKRFPILPVYFHCSFCCLLAQRLWWERSTVARSSSQFVTGVGCRSYSAVVDHFGTRTRLGVYEVAIQLVQIM